MISGGGKGAKMIEVRLPIFLAGFFDVVLSSGGSCGNRHGILSADLE